MALARYTIGEPMFHDIGVICQGKTTGNACFWNSIEDVAWNRSVAPIARFAGGTAFSRLPRSPCTECHLGPDAFFVPRADLYARIDVALKPDVWYTPIVPDGWPRNRGPLTTLESVPLAAGQKACTSCHNAASRSQFAAPGVDAHGYCLMLAVTYTGDCEERRASMPPDHPGDPAYRPQYDEFIRQCARTATHPTVPAVGAVSCSVFDNGYANASTLGDAVYFAGPEQACVPDGTAQGYCRRWFGRCTLLATGRPVNFMIFDNGETNRSAAADAVYVRDANVACVSDATPTGTCRRWFGLAHLRGRPPGPLLSVQRRLCGQGRADARDLLSRTGGGLHAGRHVDRHVPEVVRAVRVVIAALGVDHRDLWLGRSRTRDLREVDAGARFRRCFVAWRHTRTSDHRSRTPVHRHDRTGHVARAV